MVLSFRFSLFLLPFGFKKETTFNHVGNFNDLHIDTLVKVSKCEVNLGANVGKHQ